jgi:fatty-acyl-CoA synthase
MLDPSAESTSHALCADLAIEDPVRYRARQTPKRRAILELATGSAMTYQELDVLIDQAATAISAMVEMAGDEPPRIAVFGRNSILQLAVALACQRMGAMFAPLNWRLGADELQRIIVDCDPQVLLYAVEFADTVTAMGAAIAPLMMTLDGDDGFASRLAMVKPVPQPARPGSTPCIMLYTSGTTGAPKGVVITAANALCAAINFAVVGNVGADCVTLCDLPLFHIIGLAAVARTTLMVGGLLVLNDRFAPERTLVCLADRQVGVSHYFAVPQMAAALRASPHYDPGKLRALKAIFIGGAPLSKPLIDTFLADGVALVNGYGMSEAGTAIHMPIDRQMIAENPGAVGFAAPLLEIRFVGSDGEDVTEGDVGEIWLRGPSLTSGYWRKPKETEAAFVNGWYRTGDLGQRRPNGAIHVPDRLKDMYISGGENVYPAEVEGIISAHPKVLDVAVIGVASLKWGEAGVAYVVSRDQTLSQAEIFDHCAQKLASFKRPTELVFIDAIPRTTSGKVQKHILKQAYAAQAKAD